jgi:hypothetical protein
MSEDNVFGVVANVVSDRVLRVGAKVWVGYCNGDAEKPKVVGCSKGGRVVEKYSAYKRLTNYRAAWMPEHLRDKVNNQFASKADAQAAADSLTKMWGDVRAYGPKGQLIKDGISAGEAFKRLRKEA